MVISGVQSTCDITEVSVKCATFGPTNQKLKGCNFSAPLLLRNKPSYLASCSSFFFALLSLLFGLKISSNGDIIFRG